MCTHVTNLQSLYTLRVQNPATGAFPRHHYGSGFFQLCKHEWYHPSAERDLSTLPALAPTTHDTWVEAIRLMSRMILSAIALIVALATAYAEDATFRETGKEPFAASKLQVQEVVRIGQLDAPTPILFKPMSDHAPALP